MIDGEICPECESDNVIGGAPHDDRSIAQLKCQECGHIWEKYRVYPEEDEVNG